MTLEKENRMIEHRSISEAAVVRAEVDDISRIKAFVILTDDSEKPDITELQTWCKETLLGYQYPHTVDFVEDFPRTATGKIQRFKLRTD